MKAHALILILTLLCTTGLSLAGDPPTGSDGWQPLFDGKSLGHWRPSDFSGNGHITVKDGAIAIENGKPMSGITWTNEPPARMNFEIELDAMRTDGNDFFCGLTFPVGTNYCTFIAGGWGGMVTGLSNVDNFDASENETTGTMTFETNRWYHVRVKVTQSKIEAWIDKQKLVDLATDQRHISVRWEVEASIPLGIATWNTAAAVRNLRIRKLVN